MACLVAGRGPVNGPAVDGWVAEVGPKGQRFLIPAQLKGKINLGKPFEGKWHVTQLLADRPEVYKVFSYDGVPLRGHNGVDFGTPNGTKLLATDDGEVVQVGYEEKGFGNFVKLSHAWGESVYAHMEKVSVKEGDKVKRGACAGPRTTPATAAARTCTSASASIPTSAAMAGAATMTPSPS